MAVNQGSRSGDDNPSSYETPTDFSNLDEQAISPPVDNPEDRHTYRRRSDLEDVVGENVESSSRRRTQRHRGDDHSQHRQRTGKSGDEGLTEVAAPPPVQDRSSADEIEHRRYLEDGADAEGDDAEQDSEDSTAPPPFAPGSARNHSQHKSDGEVPKWLTEVYTVSYLIFFALMGTLARLGVQWLTFYPGSPVTTPVIWANFGGSMIMGFLAEDQSLFRNSRKRADAATSAQREKAKQRNGTNDDEEYQGMSKAEFGKHKKTIPLYIGLATGFCGSFTSFSSFARDYFLALSNNLPAPISHPTLAGTLLSTSATVSRNGGYSFLALLAVILQTLALSLGGLLMGAQLAIFLEPFTPALSYSFVRKILDRAMVVLAFGCWLGAVFLAIWPPDRPDGPSSRGPWTNETWRGEVLFALVFAPLGCLLRFYVSLKLNGLVPAFPLGTFAVNMLGTAVEGMCYDIQHVRVGVMGRVGGGRVGCQVLQGVMDGFCGCLTTVSTWVAEINALKRKHGWLYALGTLLGGLGLMVVIMGSVRWSVGFSTPMCDTGYPNKIHGVESNH